jgi:nucleotide-binding universal stress UspA family protein
LRRVVVAHDTSSHSQRALELAVDVATTFGLALDLVHVLPDPIYPAYYGGAATLELALQRERLATAARAELERRLAEARAGIATVPGTEPRSTQLPSTELPSSELHTPAGDPAQEIAEIAERTGAGLIVIATHGLSGLDRVPIGSVTERLVRIAQCAVLVVPAKSSAASEAGASDRDYA